MDRTDDDLTPQELQTLRRFDASEPPLDVHPAHFAKLLSMALIEQRPGGPELTDAGRHRLSAAP